MITFDQWKSNYKELENIKENHDQLEAHGIYVEGLTEETKTVRLYKEGGYLEILKDKTYLVGLDRSIFTNESIDPIEKLLFEWCDGEFFN